MRMVIGAGADGLRAAASLAVAGHAVLLLQQTATAHGRQIPELPVDVGRIYTDGAQRARVEAVLGPLVEAPDLVSGVVIRGGVHRLPLGIRAALQLFEPRAAPQVFGRWMECQFRNAIIPLTGEGREERTYGDWLTRRIGEAAMHHLFRSYAERRWGVPVETLSCTVARVAHGGTVARGGQVVGGGPAAALAHAQQIILDHGGEIRTQVSIDGLRVADGRVVSVRSDQGEISVEGPLWVARPPRIVANWLGEALPESLHRDAEYLMNADSVQVDMAGGPDNLPDVLHILDPSADFYRVVQTYGGERRWVFHTTRTADTCGQDLGLPKRFAQQAERLGLGRFDPDGARVERLVEHVPIWRSLVHPRLRRLALAWRSLGIVSVGGRGIFAPIGPGAEIVLASQYAEQLEPDQREAQRLLSDPPVLSGSLRTRFSDLLIR